MAWTPENSAIRVTAEIEAELKKAVTPDEMKKILADAAVDQNLATRDAFNPDLLHATALADAAPKRFAKVVVINGEQHALEADSAEDLAKAETDLYQEVFGRKSDTGTTEQRRDPTTGRFVEQRTQPTDGERAVLKSQLHMQFSLGQISLDDYLQKSGAIDEYLAKQGIDVQVLKDASAERAESQKVVNDWAAATDQFLRDPNNDWPGGERNRQVLSQIIMANDLGDQPSAETIRQAYQFMRENGLLEHQQVERDTAIGEATSREQLNELLGYGRRNHQEFGR